MNINNEFIENNYKLVQYIASKIGSKLSSGDREDLVQDTVERLLLAGDKGTIALQQGASSYISRIMTNILLNKNRDDNTDALTHAHISLDEDTDKSVGGNGGYTYHEVIPDKNKKDTGVLYRDDIHDLCSRLPPRQAEVFNMRYYLGMTPIEISECIGLSVDAVNDALYNAKSNAYKLISEDMEGVL